jgi:hypothetical protein
VFRGGRSSRAGVEQVEPERGQHLVIARTAEMHAPAGRADTRRQPPLERRLAVFVGELDLPVAGGMFRADRVEPFANGLQVRIRQQLLRVEHFRVRDRCAHVVAAPGVQSSR